MNTELNTELNTSQPLPFDQAGQQIHQLCMDIFLHAIQHPDDLTGATERLGGSKLPSLIIDACGTLKTEI
jgi:hypothetical protein